jgi:hypothetical protein
MMMASEHACAAPAKNKLVEEGKGRQGKERIHKKDGLGAAGGPAAGDKSVLRHANTHNRISIFCSPDRRFVRIRYNTTISVSYSKSPLPGGFWVFLWSSRKGLAEIDRGFRV